MRKIESELRKILKAKHDVPNTLTNRENSKLEFKETFNLGSKISYAKTIAGFANNNGGYIVFGVKDSPHELKGVNSNNFNAVDPVKLTQYLNDHLSPEIEWEMGNIEIDGVELGFIYTSEAVEKPVICIKNDGVLKEGEIYYRYRGQSTTIKFSELRSIIESRLERERRAWIQHLDVISKVGPTKVGILDTVHGQILGGGAPFLIEESLLRDLKFIREGRFSETQGDPTLKLMGEVKPIHGAVIEKAIHVGIHIDDLYSSFLAQRELKESEALSYLKEAGFQNTPFIPIHYFLKLSGEDRESGISILKDAAVTFPSTRNRIVRRLSGTETIKPVGSIDSSVPKFKTSDIEKALEALSSAGTQQNYRTKLVKVLKESPETVIKLRENIERMRLLESITHIDSRAFKKNKVIYLTLLLNIYNEAFQGMEGGEKTLFRKVVSYADEALYST